MDYNNVFSEKVATSRKQLEKLVNKNTTYVLPPNHVFTESLFHLYDFIIAMVSVKDGGYHWICIVPSVTPNAVSVFSTYGLDPTNNPYYDVRQVIPPKYFVQTYNVSDNYSGFQSPGSDVCGEYCVVFSQLAEGSIEKMYKMGYQNANSPILLKEGRPNETSLNNDKLALKQFNWMKKNFQQ